jgi:hypothetical protein
VGGKKLANSEVIIQVILVLAFLSLVILRVTGNMDFLKLQERVLADIDFRNRMCNYMKNTICEVIENPHLDDFIDDPADPIEVFMEMIPTI